MKIDYLFFLGILIIGGEYSKNCVNMLNAITTLQTKESSPKKNSSHSQNQSDNNNFLNHCLPQVLVRAKECCTVRFGQKPFDQFLFQVPCTQLVQRVHHYCYRVECQLVCSLNSLLHLSQLQLIQVGTLSPYADTLQDAVSPILQVYKPAISFSPHRK